MSTIPKLPEGVIVATPNQPEGISIPGLPEGLVVLRYGVPSMNEYVLLPNDCVGRITATGQPPQLIVTPSSSFRFVPTDGTQKQFTIDRDLDQLLITATFTVLTKLQRDHVLVLLSRVRNDVTCAITESQPQAA